MLENKISVLVVDDSAFMRKAMKRMLRSDPMIRVCSEASTGLEALDKIKRLRPDVVTLDVKMPGMDGLQTLDRIMKECPVPVLMVSSLTSEGGEITLRALEIGAVDFIDKSSCHTTMDIIEIAESLIQKIKMIARVDIRKVMGTKSTSMPKPSLAAPSPAIEQPPKDENPSFIVAIGTSTGGPIALESVLPYIPGDYPGAVLVVQHMPVGFTSSLAQRMNQKCQLEVKEAEEDDIILPRRVYIAPGGYHLKLQNSFDKFYIALSKDPADAPHRPSVDVMMNSVAQVWPGIMLGVIMTGMGNDGSQGIQAIKRKGGMIIAQNEETCVVFGMPRAAQNTGCVDRMLPLDRIASEINRFALTPAC